MPECFPKCFSLYVVPKKNPAKFPPNFPAINQGEIKGTNGAEFAVSRRFLLIFAFPGNSSILEAQIFAEKRRKPQIFAENLAETRLCKIALFLFIPP